MEQDHITGLYRFLGLSVGAKFSPEDVSLLFSKVFHVPSNSDAACVAMEKIAGDDSGWCCVGENVLDVLLEMEREREKKDKLFWDLQLLNVGNLNTLHETDELMEVKNTLHLSRELKTLRKAHSQSESGSPQPGIFGTYSPQRERPMGNKELHGNVRAAKKLKKAFRQSWMRLASEGVQSILPCPAQGDNQGCGCQVWGCISLSDVLLSVEVKYDVVTHLLYTEMLQEHHTLSIWETLTHWQQQQEEEDLEYLVDKALESGDMLCLAELPGAFRIYRAHQASSLKSHYETKGESWSAVSFLSGLHTFRQQEKDTLAVLGQRLDREDLRLMCLFIRLATLGAQRENMSYKALLAARQSWEAWPQVKSPCRAEQAALWLHGGEKEERQKDLISASPQQAALQLLVLTQEQERKHLIKLLHGVSREDLQDPESSEQIAVRNDLIARLKQIYADLQTQNESPTPSNQHQPHLQMDHMSSELRMWFKFQLEGCSLLLLTQVMELQEITASTLLPALMDGSAQSVQALRDKFESELHAQHITLKLLVSEAPSTSGSSLSPKSNLVDKSINEQITALSSCSGPLDAQNASGRSAETQAVVPTRGGSRAVHAVEAVDETDTQDICEGCGAVMEDLPYLEILCVSDATSNPPQCLAAEEAAKEEDEEASAMKNAQNFEKQGSLITLAWSKPPGDDTDCEAEAADGDAGHSQDSGSGLKTQICQSHMDNRAKVSTQYEEISRERDRLIRSDYTDHPDSQVTSDGRALANQPEQREAVSHCDLQAHHYIDPPMIEQLSVDLRSALANETVYVDSAVVEMETCPAETESDMWNLKGTELANTEDQNNNSQVTVDSGSALKEKKRESSLMERERAIEPVSAVERERTMRNLVDMQRKVEQRQQRDRERQLLRVQERLSIIQHRKAEEDLLGLKGEETLKHLTQDLPQEDKNQQKTVVRERLEQLRRERSYVMQSKRERNTAGFKELLGPVAVCSREPDDEAD
ncbi:uncharacterized protein LOC117814889 isoform X2 [Notolabrus celidotus]|uniref:uncharacterized protein LOC117814889 isoform X2 n=1 Tax=Notolabrus celidotus TaxID=1203425 RepID=UPI0014901263|nr:uncharacterized protein LOC117814889 isoform X2 [Notolabrus celidotus]